MVASTLPVLYSFRRCPYAMRARMAIAVSEVRCELREVTLKNKPAEMLIASPKGTVPVLVLADGKVIDQSLDIMRWALQQHDPAHWLPVGVAAASQAEQMILECDSTFKLHLDRYKYPHRFALANGEAHRALGSLFLEKMAVQLASEKFLNGSHFGLSDAAIAPFVRQFAHTNIRWWSAQPWPTLQAWLERFESSELFRQAMDKVPEWANGQAAVVYPAP